MNELLGNPSKNAKNRREPKPAALSDLTPPEWLDPIATDEWKRVAPKLLDLGLLTNIDSTALASYCVSYSHFKRAESFLNENGWTVASPSGYLQPRPEVAIVNKALVHILKFCQEFGMTPSARSRMVVSLDSSKDDLEDILTPHALQ